MADQATTVAAFQLLCAECSDEIAGSNFAAAYLKYAQAEAVHSALTYELSDGVADIKRRESLDGLRKALDAVIGFTSAVDRKRFVNTKTGYKR